MAIVPCHRRAVTVCYETAAPGQASQVSRERHSVTRRQSPHPHLDPRPLPNFEQHDACHKPTLIAATRSRMTASSPRGAFSQAELTDELVTVVFKCDEFGEGW
jgi:hypothetical protein